MVLRNTEARASPEEERRLQIEKNQSLIALLQSWLEDDSESPEDQRIALEQLMRGIDAEREGGRKLFTEYLK